jgi:hypothetical protein
MFLARSGSQDRASPAHRHAPCRCRAGRQVVSAATVATTAAMTAATATILLLPRRRHNTRSNTLNYFQQAPTTLAKGAQGRHDGTGRQVLKGGPVLSCGAAVCPTLSHVDSSAPQDSRKMPNVTPACSAQRGSSRHVKSRRRRAHDAVTDRCGDRPRRENVYLNEEKRACACACVHASVSVKEGRGTLRTFVRRVFDSVNSGSPFS